MDNDANAAAWGEYRAGVGRGCSSTVSYTHLDVYKRQAVDMSASSYRDDGYWNGAVWFSHQWFFWKTMLDLGEDVYKRQPRDVRFPVRLV